MWDKEESQHVRGRVEKEESEDESRAPGTRTMLPPELFQLSLSVWGCCQDAIRTFQSSWGIRCSAKADEIKREKGHGCAKREDKTDQLANGVS